MKTVRIDSMETMTIEECVNLTGFDEVRDKVKESGVYRIMSGSRGCFDEIERVCDISSETITLMDVTDCCEFLTYDNDDEEEKKFITEMVEEFYTLEEHDNHIIFAFTEEEFDYYVKIEL